MKTKGKLAKLLINIDSKIYTKFVTAENGQYVLYVDILRVLYELLKAEILFYKKLVKDLKEIGFRLNTYEPCVSNIIVNDKQHTIVWHVHDVKSSHADTNVIGHQFCKPSSL